MDSESLSITIDDPNIVSGLEIIDFNRNRVIQLSETASEGIAEDDFLGESAKYDVAVYYVHEPKGNSALELIINNSPVGNFRFNDTGQIYKGGPLRVQEIQNINVQKYSHIRLRFHGDDSVKCMLEKIVFVPKGAFEGKTLALTKPKTLDVLEALSEKSEGRNMLKDFVQEHTDSVMKERLAELAQLKTPTEWSAKQEQVRQRLPEFFGKFPEKTPLNAKIVDKTEREHYTIEKIIYESQPGYYVPANLYIPKNRTHPVPGIFFPCGHSDDGKAGTTYYEAAQGFARKGYVVLVVDPIGQGERSEYNDLTTQMPLVHKSVSQHHYVSRPSFLLNRTLSGLRLWDCIRGVDYLTSRPEVDTTEIAAVGNSGGGQMSLLITAVDKRIKVCAAGHPGGSMENTYLTGQTTTDREILSLIPPRPLRIIVGDSSGEERNHRAKLEDIQLFYEGLGYKKNRGELVLVDGVHNMGRPKREAAYEWINQWFDKESEGKKEAVLYPEEVKDLWCTESGSTIISLGGETAQTLNTKRLQDVYRFSNNKEDLKDHIAQRIKLTIPKKRDIPKSQTKETVIYDNFSVEKLTYESEPGITIPSLLIRSKNVKAGSPVFLYVSDKGKPRAFADTLMPFKLAGEGYIVLAVDVRGTGETNPTATLPITDRYTSYTPIQWIHDGLAIRSAAFGRTMARMRVLDMIRGIDFINSRDDLKGRKVVAVGEGLGGLWSSLVCVFDSRVAGTITNGTLPSYKLLITNKYYNVNPGYFWLPGALLDFDIPDLVRLITPRPNIWIEPVNALGEEIDSETANSILGSYKNLQIITPDKKSNIDFEDIIKKMLN